MTVTRSGGNDGAVSVNYATSNGSATATQDYTAASGTLSWGNGDGTAKSFAVTILDDLDGENAEIINLGLSSPTGGATLGASTGTITINDNETGVLALVSPPSSVAENGGSVAFTVSRSNGTSGSASVLCSATGGTATAGGDFTIRIRRSLGALETEATGRARSQSSTTRSSTETERSMFS